MVGAEASRGEQEVVDVPACSPMSFSLLCMKHGQREDKGQTLNTNARTPLKQMWRVGGNFSNVHKKGRSILLT